MRRFLSPHISQTPCVLLHCLLHGLQLDRTQWAHGALVRILVNGVGRLRTCTINQCFCLSQTAHWHIVVPIVFGLAFGESLLIVFQLLLCICVTRSTGVIHRHRLQIVSLFKRGSIRFINFFRGSFLVILLLDSCFWLAIDASGNHISGIYIGTLANTIVVLRLIKFMVSCLLLI